MSDIEVSLELYRFQNEEEEIQYLEGEGASHRQTRGGGCLFHS